MRSLLAVLLLGQALDVLTFLVFDRLVPGALAAVERSGGTLLLLQGGTGAVAAAKIGLPGAAYLRARQRPFRWDTPWGQRLATLILGIVAMTGFLGAAFNGAAIAQVLGA